MTEDATGNPLLASALSCARRGWKVFPCHANGKSPITTHGVLDASADPDQIRQWWKRHPTANLAVACGHPGPDVLDIDTKNGVSGWHTLNRLVSAGLATGYGAIVKTPSGGGHLYFRGTEQHNGTLRSFGIDFRSLGGYVVVPPSTIGGLAYSLEVWRGPGDVVDWQAIRAFLQPQQQTRPPTPDRGGDISGLVRWMTEQQPGNRNAGLFWACCRALESGADDLEPLIAAALTVGLDEREARRTAASAVRRVGTRNLGTAA
jgi:hypothetical protein